MFEIDRFEILKKNICPIKETSIDTNDGSYMTQSTIGVVNFDKVKDEYSKCLKVSETPKSNDVFFVDDDGETYFIEFKNGIIDNGKIFEVKLKIFDSFLIFSDIAGLTASFTREHMTYILVYNEVKNSTVEKNTVQNSEARTAIAKTFMGYAKQKFIRFNLTRFEKLYFKEVFTFTEREFEDNFCKKYSHLCAG